MWNSFDAIKEIVEQPKKLLNINKEQSAANDALLKETENQKVASKNFSQSKQEYESITEDVQRLKKKLAEAEHLHDQSRKDLEAESRNLELANAKFTDIRDKVESVNNVVSTQIQTIRQAIKNEYNAPAKYPIEEVNIDDDAKNSSRIHALGDLHGWAPGLISYLTFHNLAKIEISGIMVYESQPDGKISLNIESMCKLFPDLVDHLSNSPSTEEDVKRESFVHAGILGQPAGDLNFRSNYCKIDAEWIGADEFLFQIGDVFDRADHGEISAEILRQLIIQAPAHVFVLVGNHEEFLLCNQYNGWYRNEVKWDYNIKQHHGNTRNLADLYPGSTPEKLFKDTYEKYKQSAAMLFLTQYFAKRKLSSDTYSDISHISEKELEIYSNRILKGDWEGYIAASELHEKILKSATRDGVRFPGAFALLATGDSIFMHAEPNGLSKYLSGLSSQAITRLRNPVQIGNRDYLFDDLQICFDGDSYSSNNTELFWARGASTGYEALDSKFGHLAPQIINILPGVRNIIHGHSPVPHEHDANKPHTYVGRILGNDVTSKNGEVRVYNIDEGITPVYQNKMSTSEKMNTIPIGLQLPKQLESLHESGEIISEDDLWELNSMFVERESLPFTVGKELRILESPTQYAVNGPGSIEINSEFDDNKYYAYTKEDEFRTSPHKFSWLSIGKPENMTNPLEGRKPPHDGVYRVQTKNHGSITLAENLLKILDISPFPKTSKFQRKLIKPFSNANEVKKYVFDIMIGGSLWDKIVQSGGTSEIFACEGTFFTLRSTSDPNILNFSIFNMDVDKTFIFSNRDDTTSSSILEISVKSKECVYGSWAEKSADSTVVISMLGSDGKSVEVFSGIFGECKNKSLFDHTDINSLMYSTNATQARELSDNAAVLEDKTVRETQIANNEIGEEVDNTEVNHSIDMSSNKLSAEPSNAHDSVNSNLRTSVGKVLTLDDSQIAEEAEAKAAKEAESNAAKEAESNAAKEAEANAAKEAEANAAKEAEAEQAEIETDEDALERQAAALNAKRVAEENKKYI